MRVEILAFDNRDRLLLHTWHTTRGGLRLELEVHKVRMKRGDVAWIKVIDMDDATVEPAVVMAGSPEAKALPRLSGRGW